MVEELFCCLLREGRCRKESISIIITDELSSCLEFPTKYVLSPLL